MCSKRLLQPQTLRRPTRKLPVRELMFAAVGCPGHPPEPALVLCTMSRSATYPTGPLLLHTTQALVRCAGNSTLQLRFTLFYDMPAQKLA